MYYSTGKENPPDFIEGSSPKLKFSWVPPVAAVPHWLEWDLLPVANGAAEPDLDPVLPKALGCLSLILAEFVFDL